jgi:hypothetical protein
MIEESRGLLTPEAAETLAVQAFSWIAEQPDVLGRFLSLTGIGPATIRSAAVAPGFAAGVLDFLAGDEALLVAFAAAVRVPPERVAAAGRLLNRPVAP